MYTEEQRIAYGDRVHELRKEVDRFINEVNETYPEGVPDMPSIEREIDTMMVALVSLKDKTYGIKWGHQQPWVKRLRKFLGYTYP